MWFEYAGTVREDQREALESVIFACQYKIDKVGFIDEDDERVEEIKEFPSVADYVASFSPSFADLKRDDHSFARPLPEYALAEVSIQDDGSLSIEQEDWIVVDDHALALILSDFMEEGSRVTISDEEHDTKWSYLIKGQGQIETDLKPPFEAGDLVTSHLKGPGVINNGGPRVVLEVERSIDCGSGWLLTVSSELGKGRRPQRLPIGMSRKDADWFKLKKRAAQVANAA